MNEGQTIQQIAQRTGLSIHTLRYYERVGLLISVRRLSNAHRRHDESDQQWIPFAYTPSKPSWSEIRKS